MKQARVTARRRFHVRGLVALNSVEDIAMLGAVRKTQAGGAVQAIEAASRVSKEWTQLPHYDARSSASTPTANSSLRKLSGANQIFLLDVQLTTPSNEVSRSVEMRMILLVYQRVQGPPQICAHLRARPAV